MNYFHKTAFTIFAICALPFSTLVLADSATSEEHSVHHDQTSSQPELTTETEQMQKMQALHARIMSAKTPAELNKLLAEQRDQMQSMMATMKGMMSQGANGMMSSGGMMGNGAAGDTAMMVNKMNQRMDMMQQMMQGLMDQQAGVGAMK